MEGVPVLSPAAAARHAVETSCCAVSFIVPAFSAARTLPACISSIREAAPAGSEVIIVVDGSTDDTPRIAAELADQVIRRRRQGGAARARNDGALAARGDVLFFVDADVTVNRGAVEGALAHLEGDVDAVFGAYTPLPPAELQNVPTTYKNLLHHHTHLLGRPTATTFWSGFGAVRREAFLTVQGFDSAATRSADVEDVHLGYRLRAAGFRILLDATLQVEHHKRYSLRSLVMSDVAHRAIPWTKAILELRSLSLDLNLRLSAVVASLMAVAAVAAAAATVFVGVVALAAAGGLLAAWGLLNARFLVYVGRRWSLKGMLVSAALLFLYSLYCPVGFLLGVGLHTLSQVHGRRTESPELRFGEHS